MLLTCTQQYNIENAFKNIGKHNEDKPVEFHHDQTQIFHNRSYHTRINLHCRTRTEEVYQACLNASLTVSRR